VELVAAHARHPEPAAQRTGHVRRERGQGPASAGSRKGSEQGQGSGLDRHRAGPLALGGLRVAAEPVRRLGYVDRQVLGVDGACLEYP
jgi:hypothetical protein